MTAVCAGLIACMPHRVEAQVAAVGVVAEYAPTGARYTFNRSGNVVPIRIGTLVMAGDEVTLPARGTVTLTLANGSSRRLEGPETLRVAPAPIIGLGWRVLQAVTDILDVEYRSAQTAVSRGSGGVCDASVAAAPIVVPILREGALVSAGRRDIPLAWTGGCAPYAVSLLNGQATLAHQENLRRSQVRLDGILLAADTAYTLIISDSLGSRRSVQLTARRQAPTPPMELADLSSLGVIARALWLAEQDGGVWRLDSFEMLRPAIRSSDPLAGTIGDVLLWREGARLLGPVK
jgi:hypothetical protein